MRPLRRGCAGWLDSAHGAFVAKMPRVAQWLPARPRPVVVGEVDAFAKRWMRVVEPDPPASRPRIGEIVGLEFGQCAGHRVVVPRDLERETVRFMLEVARQRVAERSEQ